MRLWSLHPKYLDRQGLDSLWEDAIVAKNMLKRGDNHPQLNRFKADLSIECIYTYLYYVKKEGDKRGYNYKDFGTEETLDYHIPVTNGQLVFEVRHLAHKLSKRNMDAYIALRSEIYDTHPLFYVINGEKASWEISEVI